jgi:hypothetical protein
MSKCTVINNIIRLIFAQLEQIANLLRLPTQGALGFVGETGGYALPTEQMACNVMLDRGQSGGK